MLKDWGKRLCRKVRYASSELEKSVKAINTYSQDLLPAGIDFEAQLSSLTNEELVEKAIKLDWIFAFVANRTHNSAHRCIQRLAITTASKYTDSKHMVLFPLAALLRSFLLVPTYKLRIVVALLYATDKPDKQNLVHK